MPTFVRVSGVVYPPSEIAISKDIGNAWYVIGRAYAVDTLDIAGQS